MRQVAFFQRGDNVTPVEYESREGFHTFWIDGVEQLVYADPNIPPVIVTDLGDLIDEEALPRFMRFWLRRRRAEIAKTGMALRFFHEVDQAVVETAAGVVLRDMPRFLEEATTAAITKDGATGTPLLAGNVQRVEEVVQVTVRDGTTESRRIQRAASETPALDRFLVDMQRIGLDPDEAASFVSHLVRIQKSGQSASYVKNHVLEWLIRPAVAGSLLMIMGIMGVLFGLELATTTAIGDWYTDENRGYVLLAMLAVGGVAAWKLRKA